MPPSRYQHLTLQRIQTSQPRRKHPGAPTMPVREHKAHAKQVSQNAAQIVEEFSTTVQERSAFFNPALIFRANLAAAVPEAQWRGAGLTVLSVEPNKATILFASDVHLQEFQARIASYGAEVPASQKGPSYQWISCIDNLELWGSRHRLGRKLQSVTLDPATTYTVDVELWYFDTKEACRQRLDELKRFVKASNQAYLDDYLGSSLCLARVQVSGAILEQLLHTDSVAFIDLPPRSELSITAVLEMQLDDFAPIPQPPENAPRICVIDSGIERGHPMLGPAIGDTSAAPAAIGTALDHAGHGTKVAGIALYGDLTANIKSRTFAPELTLFSVRVTNDQGHFDEQTLIVNQMRDAIVQMHTGYGCRVFNISLGDADTVFADNQRPTPWATILDELAREKDIVIVVATGNCFPQVDETDHDAIARTYPDYLFAEEARIIDPAMAVNVLTVGSLAQDEGSYFGERYPRDPAYRPIAKTNQPSPFTRHGPGFAQAIKPDLCDYGGNLVLDGRQRRITRDLGAGIVSFSHQFGQGRLFTADYGSSFAAPRVAHQAARILGQYPNASANLVRALLVASAEIPPAVKELIGFQRTEEKQRVLQLCGYGKPDLERALYSSQKRVALICEESLELDHFHIFEIPIHEDFKQMGGHRQISVTLTFDPPVRRTRREYIGNQMSFKLIRGRTLDEVVEHYQALRETTGRFTSANTTNQLWPGFDARHPGTVQKGTLEIKSNRVLAYESPFYLVVRSESRWAGVEQTRQNYALVVMFEDKTQHELNLYEMLKMQIALPARVRMRA